MNSLSVALSFVVALLLTSLPLPESFIAFRPDWLLLVLVYWSMALPDRVGIFTGWIFGLTLDVMYGSLLGQNAMSLAIISYLVNVMHLRFRMFPLWQQSVVVFFLVLLHLGLTAWVRGITGNFSLFWMYWLPAVTSALIWPFLFVVLRDIRRLQVKH